MSQHETVVAIVVTYNRLKLLQRCIDSLKTQTRKPDAIVVINNNSSDGTAEWLKEQTDINFINQDNLGGAGGFYTGTKYGYDNNYDMIWCMDDDGYPKEDALEKLLAQRTGELRLLNSVVINEADRKTLVFRTKHFKETGDLDQPIINGIAHLFNSTLIDRKIIDIAGFPDKRLFVWGDETEYCYRISRKNDIELTTVTSSIHYHPASTFSYTADWDYKTNWKMYYFFRNKYFVFRSKHKSPLQAKLVYFFFVRLYALHILIFQKTDRRKKVKLLFAAAKDALKEQFDMTPPKILSGLLK